MMSMMYQAYQAQADIMASLRGVAGIALQGFGHLTPGLAESWTSTADGTTWDFKLKPK